MARQKQSGGELVHERPAWILPVLVILAVLSFSGAFLYYYFGPTPGEILGHDPKASAATRRVEAVIGGTRFLIPENYTRYPSQRSGGAQPEVAMHALLPDFTPYAPERQAEFVDNTPEANVVFFTLQESVAMLPAERRLKEVYSKYLTSTPPEKLENGLEKFGFRPDSGYKDQDLLVGTDTDGRLVLITCQRATPLIVSPNCTRSLLLTQNLALTYRYKRAHLDRWQRIDELLIRLVTSFEAPGLPSDLEGTITD